MCRRPPAASSSRLTDRRPALERSRHVRLGDTYIPFGDAFWSLHVANLICARASVCYPEASIRRERIRGADRRASRHAIMMPACILCHAMPGVDHGHEQASKSTSSVPVIRDHPYWPFQIRWPLFVVASLFVLGCPDRWTDCEDESGKCGGL